ncbi:MAG TPA: hybrid sensor histidine kinase/response regulator, partial [Polyangiales bacterium]|nr:hybrid sensor histidine kinase/response regulator [Polyangiales bacterium]
MTRDLLTRHALSCVVCASAAAVANEIAVGAAALVLTDAALSAPAFDRVLAELERQPPWSDLPVVMLCHTSTGTAVSNVIASFTNLTLLDRPASARALVSAVQTAIRSRMRQYQTREQLEALRQAEERLLHADRRKDDFLAMLAHELRGPLAPIRNSSELLARTPDRKTRTVSDILKRQTRHLSRLVDDLLDVSRITRGLVELQLRPTALGEIIAMAIESVDPLMQEKRHTVRLDLGTAALHVEGDGARLVQCVANVLTNAAKYTDPGGAIEVKLQEREGEGVISVTDNGVGMSPELLPHIFELFVQADRSLDRTQGGLGIGLSVVKQLVEMHGGSVSASSDGIGKGTRMEIRLPLQQAAAHAPAIAVPASASSRRVLIVDDNIDAADSLAMLLKMDGHDAESVYDPSIALQRVSEFDPEVILLDIGLPVMDGYEVARR